MNIDTELLAQMVREELRAVLPEVLRSVAAPVLEMEALRKKKYLRPDEVEKLYGLRATTLSNKRVLGLGPRYVQDKDRGSILYPQKDVEAWMQARKRRTYDQQ